MRGKRAASPQPVSSVLGRSAHGGPIGPIGGRGPTVPLRRRALRAADFHRALRPGCAGAVGTANGQARPHRPSPRAGPGGTAGGELRPKADAAGRQRHAAARGTKAQPTTFCAADRGRDRRLGMAAQPALWDHPLRSGKAQDHRPAARSRTGDDAGLALGPAADHRHRA